MNAHGKLKSRGGTRVSMQQVVFELKNKVVLALNKLADRDTCQIGVNELEKIAEGLNPDQIAPFLSCVLDTDKERKSAVRKECVRVLGTLVTCHENLVSPYLGKIVASIVKRLKDQDSVVRDACVETVGVLASKLSDHENESDGVFVGLVKPLFEALGEQNKQMQSGAALCLARVIDNTRDPPIALLQKMLSRTIKFLKNPHFMAKPALIELSRSIIKAGGAPAHSVLSAAMTSIQEALKDSDWTTRKAASAALGDIASTVGPFLGSYKASCIRSLESCRFDKVKPVRDTVLYSLQQWKSLPWPNSPERSETGSSIKENFSGVDYSDPTSVSSVVRKDVTFDAAVTNSSNRKIPFPAKGACRNYTVSPHSRADDWHVEIAVPKNCKGSSGDLHEESRSSSVTKTLERVNTDITSIPDTGYEYEPMDDKQDSLSTSNLADEFETEFVTISRAPAEECSKPMGRNQQFSAGKPNCFGHRFSANTKDRQSLDSTITESSSQPLHGCCSQVANEMKAMRQHLLEIESKQSNLLETVQMMSTGILDSMAILQSRLLGLEQHVDRTLQVLVNEGTHSDEMVSKLMKQKNNGISPRLSAFTRRSSVDVRSRHPSSVAVKNADTCEERTFGRRSVNSGRQSADIWINPSLKTSKSSLENMQKDFWKIAQSSDPTRKVDGDFAPVPTAYATQICLEKKNCLWQRVKGFLCMGDLDSAYAAALSSGDELVLIELLDRTGPVLESLSPRTVSDLLSTLASYFLEHRFVNSIIPWLQRVVELSITHGPDCLNLCEKTRREFFSAVQVAANMEFSSAAERRSITQLAVKLRQLWGKDIA